ncbi:transcriptional regulator [Salmonella enterica]
MKVAVLNNSGNVGKSTICQNLLMPRMSNAELFKVESINNDLQQEGQQINGRKFDELITNVMVSDSAIVDVGSSNIEEFLTQMEEYKGSHEDFNYFIIPIVPDTKQQIDSISTIVTLNGIGIENDKIKVIFNRADKKDDDLEFQYSEFLSRCKGSGFKINPAKTPVIYETTLFTKLAEMETTMLRLISENKNYDDLMRQIDKGDPDVKSKRMQLAVEKNLQRQALGVNEELNFAFKQLNLR